MDSLNNAFKPLNAFSHLAHWPLRLVLAAIFLVHGPTKFGDLEMAAGMVGGSTIVAALVAIAETAAAILLLAGPFLGDWATRIAGALVFVIMLGAIFLVHLPNGWNFMNGGYEFQLLTAVLGLYFLLKGNGVDYKVR